MEEKVEDYVKAYLRHQALCVDAPARECEKQQKIMDLIIQGAVIKFRMKRNEFLELCRGKEL